MYVTCISIYPRRQQQPTPVLLLGKSHGWRTLVDCSPWGRKESDMTERLHFHFSLSCIVEGNGNPLQCSCLENPRDWGAIYRVAQSRTRLKRLSSSGSSSISIYIKLKCTVIKIVVIILRQGKEINKKKLNKQTNKDINMFAAVAKSLQSCLTQCDPIDGSPPVSPASGILQARTLDWVAISFSNA